MTRRQGIIGLIVLLALAFALSWWLERTPVVTVEQAVAHERTQVAVANAAHSDTAFQQAKLDAATARALYRSVRDSALRDLRDTSLVKRALAKADTAFVHDTTVIVRADTVIRYEKEARVATGTELALALKPHPPPRLVTTASALYDPLSGTPAGSVQVSARVIRSFALVARVDQRAVIGEKPRAYVGIALSF